jgi:REP element-mobilizing transposase RayT
MTFWRCFYHVIWTTRQRQPLITPRMETLILDVVYAKSAELNSEIFAVNTVADHLHIAVAIPPSIAVAQWVKGIKGTTSHEINELFPSAETTFRWQKGYGVLTFGIKHLDFVVAYIEKQKEHHANNFLYADMERSDDSANG